MIRQAKASLLAGILALVAGNVWGQQITPGSGGSPSFPLLAPNGTASAPSYSFSGQTNAGMFYRPGNAIDFSGSGVAMVDLQNVGITVRNVSQFGWSGTSDATATADTTITRKAAANVQLGQADAAAPVAQILSVQSVVAGTSNTAGALWKSSDSAGTGTGVGGGYEWDVHPAGSTGTSQNAGVSAYTISGAGLHALPLISSDATRTDASVCEDTTTHALYSGSGTLGICLGTSSARFKHDIRPLDYGLDAVMALDPISYKLNADHGDPNKTLLGFTAEQVQMVIPELVGLDGLGAPNTADYIGLIPVLIKAVQQQQAEIDMLRAKAAAEETIRASYRRSVSATASIR